MLRGGHMTDTDIDHTIAAAYERVRKACESPFDILSHKDSQKAIKERIERRRTFLGAKKTLEIDQDMFEKEKMQEKTEWHWDLHKDIKDEL